MSVISELVNKFVGLNSSVVDNGLDAHADIVLGDDLLGSQLKYIRLHVDQYDVLGPRIDKVEAWLEDL